MVFDPARKEALKVPSGAAMPHPSIGSVDNSDAKE